MYVIHCGNGQQKVEWLGDTACHRYDPDYLWDVGTVQDIRLKNGVQIDMKHIVCEELQDDVHVYVQLLGKYLKRVKEHVTDQAIAVFQRILWHKRLQIPMQTKEIEENDHSNTCM